MYAYELKPGDRIFIVTNYSFPQFSIYEVIHVQRRPGLFNDKNYANVYTINIIDSSRTNFLFYDDLDLEKGTNTLPLRTTNEQLALETFKKLVNFK